MIFMKQQFRVKKGFELGKEGVSAEHVKKLVRAALERGIGPGEANQLTHTLVKKFNKFKDSIGSDQIDCFCLTCKDIGHDYGPLTFASEQEGQQAKESSIPTFGSRSRDPKLRLPLTDELSVDAKLKSEDKKSDDGFARMDEIATSLDPRLEEERTKEMRKTIGKLIFGEFISG